MLAGLAVKGIDLQAEPTIAAPLPPKYVGLLGGYVRPVVVGSIYVVPRIALGASPAPLPPGPSPYVCRAVVTVGHRFHVAY